MSHNNGQAVASQDTKPKLNNPAKCPACIIYSDFDYCYHPDADDQPATVAIVSST